MALPDAVCAAIVALTQLPSASPHDTAAATVHERAHTRRTSHHALGRATHETTS